MVKVKRFAAELMIPVADEQSSSAICYLAGLRHVKVLFRFLCVSFDI